MIIDTSAALAMLLSEPDTERYAAALAEVVAGDPGFVRMSAASLFETAMLIERKGDETARARFDTFERTYGIRVVPFDREHAGLARLAWRQFGKGSGHSAHLNFGDCMAYALARQTGEPLLFKGNDFSQTDIEPALKP